jgi:hypothetical protein
MSVGVKIKHQQAPALVHRKPGRVGLVLSDACQLSATLEICQSQHASDQGQCSDPRAAPFEPIGRWPNAQHQQGHYVESP